jgi:ribosomal protein L11 methylase PrmA
MRDSYQWESLKDGTVVDVGGGSGHVSMALAKVSLSPR